MSAKEEVPTGMKNKKGEKRIFCYKNDWWVQYRCEARDID
jgi:hypothetical protein